MNLVYEFTNLEFPVKVEQDSDGLFNVTYGQQLMSDLCYDDAAMQIGLAILHSAGCAGLLNKETYK